jgi:hypothetical protein
VPEVRPVISYEVVDAPLTSTDCVREFSEVP